MTNYLSSSLSEDDKMDKRFNFNRSRSYRPHHSHNDHRYRPQAGDREGRHYHHQGGHHEGRHIDRGAPYHHGDDRHHSSGRPHSIKDRLSYRDRVLAKYSREDQVTVKREQHRDSESEDSDDPRVRHRPKKIIKVEKEDNDKGEPSFNTWSHASSNPSQATSSSNNKSVKTKNIKSDKMSFSTLTSRSPSFEKNKVSSSPVKGKKKEKKRRDQSSSSSSSSSRSSTPVKRKKKHRERSRSRDYHKELKRTNAKIKHYEQLEMLRILKRQHRKKKKRKELALREKKREKKRLSKKKKRNDESSEESDPDLDDKLSELSEEERSLDSVLEKEDKKKRKKHLHLAIKKEHSSSEAEEEQSNAETVDSSKGPSIKTEVEEGSNHPPDTDTPPALKKKPSSNLTLNAINRVLFQNLRKRKLMLKQSKSDDEIEEIIIDGPEPHVKVENVETSDDDIIIVPCEKSIPNAIGPKRVQNSNVVPPSKVCVKQEEDDLEFCYFNFITSRTGSEVTQFEVSFCTRNEVVTFDHATQSAELLQDKLKDALAQIFDAKPVKNLVLVVPTVNQMQWFSKVNSEKVFQSWIDLSLLVRNSRFGKPTMMKAQKEDKDLLRKLFSAVCYDDVCTAATAVRSTLLMKQIIEKIVATNPLLKIANFAQSFSEAEQRYLMVLVHVEVSNLDIKGDFNLDSISYSANKDVAWLRNITSNLPEGENSKTLNEKHDRGCLKSGEALTQFLDSLEGLRKDGNYDKVAVVFLKNDKSFPILLSHICELDLFEKFLGVVGAVGSIQDCAGAKNLNLNQNKFQAFEKLYFKRFGLDVNFENNKNVTKYAFQLFQDLFREELSAKESFVKKYFSPVISSRVNSWLCSSEIVSLNEEYHGLIMGERAFIKPAESDTVLAYLRSALPADIGKMFKIKQLCGNGTLEIKSRNVRLGENFSLNFEIENKSSKVICLEIGEKIGMLSKDENFMSLIGSESLPENETSNLSSLDKLSAFPEDLTTIEKTECETRKENLIPSRQSKLALFTSTKPDTDKTLTMEQNQNDKKSTENIDIVIQAMASDLQFTQKQPSKPSCPEKIVKRLPSLKDVLTKRKPPLKEEPPMAKQEPKVCLQANINKVKEDGPKCGAKNKLSFSEWKARKKQMKEGAEIAINTQSSTNNGCGSKGSFNNFSPNEQDNISEPSCSQELCDSRLSEPGNQEEKKCSREAEQTVTTEESSSENVESCVQNEPSLMGSDGPGAGATGETGKLDLDKVSSECSEPSEPCPSGGLHLVTIKDISQDALDPFPSPSREYQDAIKDRQLESNEDIGRIVVKATKETNRQKSIAEDKSPFVAATGANQDSECSRSLGTIELEPVSPGSNASDVESAENAEKKLGSEQERSDDHDPALEPVESPGSPERGNTPEPEPALGTIQLEPVTSVRRAQGEDSDISLSDGEFDQIYGLDAYSGDEVRETVAEKETSPSVSPNLFSHFPAQIKTEASSEFPDVTEDQNNVPVRVDSEKIKLLKESSRKQFYKAPIALCFEGKKLSVKLRKCQVELVRLRKKELKLKQKVIKRKREVWIEKDGGCVKKGSSLRVAIKESLKMKNDAEAKKNDSKLNVQSIAKSSSTNKSSKKKTANADKGKRVALNPGNAEENLKLPEKVKTLIDPQTPLMEQMKKIHAALPGMAKQPKWMMFSELSQAVPIIKRAPELEDLLLTFVQFYQVPISGLGEDLRQFAEMLITDLLEAGITASKSIGKLQNFTD